MKALKVLLSTLLLSSLTATPALLAKEGKKANKAVKECEEKGGKWDKKKKSCQVEAKAAPAGESTPAPAASDAAPAAEESTEPAK